MTNGLKTVIKIIAKRALIYWQKPTNNNQMQGNMVHYSQMYRLTKTLVVQLNGRLNLNLFNKVFVKMTSCNNEQLYYYSIMCLEFIKVFVKVRNEFIDNFV